MNHRIQILWSHYPTCPSLKSHWSLKLLQLSPFISLYVFLLNLWRMWFSPWVCLYCGLWVSLAMYTAWLWEPLQHQDTFLCSISQNLSYLFLSIFPRYFWCMQKLSNCTAVEKGLLPLSQSCPLVWSLSAWWLKKCGCPSSVSLG
jgi:hypothetical protein